MNLKASFKYQIDEYKKSVMLYYLIVILVILFFAVSVNFTSNNHFSSQGGIEGATVIFIFVAGLNSFKETFLMLLQNGVSRKTMFFGRLAATGILCGGMMVIDRLILAIIGVIVGDSQSFSISGLYEEFFQGRIESLGFLQKNLEAILFTLCCYFMAFALGYFITTAYYRMNKLLKIVVSVGVPVSLFFILPLVDSTITNGRIARFIGYMIRTVYGLGKDHPYNFMISSLVTMIVLFGLSWILIRRAVDKK